MQPGFVKVTLANLCDGAAAELFDRELQQALQNVADPNTKAKTKRTITLTVELVPTEDRSRADVSVKCAAKLAQARQAETSLDLGQEGRSQVAYQRSQPEAAPDNVRGMGGF